MKTAMERIHTNALPIFEKLTILQKAHIQDFLEANQGYTIFDENDMIEAYLSWHGIINYGATLTLFFKNVLKA